MDRNEIRRRAFVGNVVVASAVAIGVATYMAPALREEKPQPVGYQWSERPGCQLHADAADLLMDCVGPEPAMCPSGMVATRAADSRDTVTGLVRSFLRCRVPTAVPTP